MGLEAGTYVNDLVTTNPTGSDNEKQGDDHLRLIKSVLKTTFPTASLPFYFPTVISKTANYTVLATDAGALILCDATAGSFTLALTAVATLGISHRFSVVKTDSTANTVTIDPNAAETINGATTLVLRYQYEGVRVANNATAWFTEVFRELGRQSVYIPAAAMKANTTNGPSAGSNEMATNKNMLVSLDYDPTTQQFGQFSFRFPKSWNLGTVSFVALWTHPATTVNFGVVWGLDAVAVSDTDAQDAAFGTAQTATDTGGTTNTLYISPESAAITIAGTPTLGDAVNFRIHRDPANVSDTMAVNARLQGIMLFYTVTSLRDD